MRVVLLALPLLAGCAEALVPVGVLTAGSLVAVGRTAPDALVSLGSGRDCSIAHVETEGVYCRPAALAQPAPRTCTRSLGHVDCWTTPPAATPPYRRTADGPPPAGAQPWPRGLVP
jgi:hypothetical protein